MKAQDWIELAGVAVALVVGSLSWLRAGKANRIARDGADAARVSAAAAERSADAAERSAVASEDSVKVARESREAEERRHREAGRARIYVRRGGAMWSAMDNRARAYVLVAEGVPARNARVTAARFGGREIPFSVDLETIRHGAKKIVNVPLEPSDQGLAHEIALRISWTDDAGDHQEWFTGEAA